MWAGCYTLVEVMIALAISVTLFGSLIASFLAVKSLNTMARHKIQAVQIVRGQIENLKAGTFATIANGTQASAYDAGADGTFGTADDMQGTLSTTVQDLVDFDADGNTAETQINIDGTGGNDAVALPLRVSFAWDEYVVGMRRSLSVSADTIIGS